MLLLIYSGNCCCSIFFNSAVEANQDFSLLVDYLKCIFRPSEPLVISQTDLHYGVDSFLILMKVARVLIRSSKLS